MGNFPRVDQPGAGASADKKAWHWRDTTDEPRHPDQTVRLQPRFLRLASGWETQGMLPLESGVCFAPRSYLMSRMRRRNSAIHPSTAMLYHGGFVDMAHLSRLCNGSAGGQCSGGHQLTGQRQHMCSQSGACPGAHGPHQEHSAGSNRSFPLSWRIREYFCGLTAAPHASLFVCNAQSFASIRPLVLQRLNSVTRQASLMRCITSPFVLSKSSLSGSSQ